MPATTIQVDCRILRPILWFVDFFRKGGIKYTKRFIIGTLGLAVLFITEFVTTRPDIKIDKTSADAGSTVSRMKKAFQVAGKLAGEK